MPKVTILSEKVSVDVAAGTVLLDAGDQAGVVMAAGCTGCSCGTCAVEVVRGMENLAPPTLDELSVLYQRHKDAAKYRLACCARIMDREVVIREVS